MLSNAKIKYIKSLHKKKYRQQHAVFIVEGEKIVREVLQQKRFKLQAIYGTEAWASQNTSLMGQYKPLLTIVPLSKLKKISTLKTPNQVLALLEMPAEDATFTVPVEQSFNLVLEQIQDPGNMGTIIRIADWFGIPNIICSKGCVEAYNPKVIQATMGSFLRVNIQTIPLQDLFATYAQLPVYGAVLGGDNLFETDLSPKGFLLIGNEGRGLSTDAQQHLTHRLTIPKYGQAESLNAAVATGIFCAMFRKP